MSMHKLVVALVFVGTAVAAPHAASDAAYWSSRDHMVEKDHSHGLGSGMKLNPKEVTLNSILRQYIKAEMDKAFTSLDFAPAKNFMLAKEEMEKTDLFKVIKTMPKGGILHVHDSSMTSLEFVIKNITYWDDLYYCDMETRVAFKFSESLPTSGCQAKWVDIKTARASASSPETFDDHIMKCLSIITDTPDTDYPDINTVWQKFDGYFIGIGGLVAHRPALEAYFSEAMRQFYEDGVTYFEFRAVLGDVYEMDGTKLTYDDLVAMYENSIKRFVAEHQDHFFGGRLIFAPPRHTTEEHVWELALEAVHLQAKFPEFVAGFDLVGQEDKGQPLTTFVKPLLNMSAEHVPFFFHAGETNWYGEPTDGNLYDALLLNTSRIGHGFALPKHPELLQQARDQGIAIEANPISNQVLLLVKDLRNHPGAGWAATNQPMVVSSDDPGVWGALPLTHDFYEALLAFGGADVDLRFLKQLAINSIKYSSLDATRKSGLMDMWQGQWNAWVEAMINKI